VDYFVRKEEAKYDYFQGFTIKRGLLLDNELLPSIAKRERTIRIVPKAIPSDKSTTD